jgi:hypothetical protein
MLFWQKWVKQMQRKKIILAVVVALTMVSTSAPAATKKLSSDWLLPIKKITPGVINKDVTQENIKENICKAGWTATIRPTVIYTNKLKATQLAGDYKKYVAAFGEDSSLYEEDHLISLQLGGSPTDSKNLWPEPYAGNGARKKDVIETKLKRLVCSGDVKLADAQKAIAINWVLAYNKYITPADAKAPIDTTN